MRLVRLLARALRICWCALRTSWRALRTLAPGVMFLVVRRWHSSRPALHPSYVSGCALARHAYLLVRLAHLLVRLALFLAALILKIC